MMDMMWVVFCSVSFVSMCGGEVLDNRIGSCSKGYANGAVEKAWESMDSDTFLVSPYKRQRVSPCTDSTTKRTHTHTRETSQKDHDDDPVVMLILIVSRYANTFQRSHDN
jgi:hypothetical protein